MTTCPAPDFPLPVRPPVRPDDYPPAVMPAVLLAAEVVKSGSQKLNHASIDNQPITQKVVSNSQHETTTNPFIIRT